MFKLILKENFQGQTLIETMAAIFILTMGVTAGVGLANYALGSSTSVAKQVVATGLAREGLEAVKNMRDTNWLQAGAINTNCYNYVNTSANDGQCYKNWLTLFAYGAANTGRAAGAFSNLNPPSNPTNYVLTFWGSDIISPLVPSFWHQPYSNWALYQSNNSVAENAICGNSNVLSYALDLNQTTPVNTLNNYGAGYYVPSCKAVGSSGFYRKIILQVITTPPFDKSDINNDAVELLVKSQVWWTDSKRCGPSSDWPGPGKCSLELDTYLTNWKNF